MCLACLKKQKDRKVLSQFKTPRKHNRVTLGDAVIVLQAAVHLSKIYKGRTTA